MLTTSEATQHAAAENGTSSDEQYALEALSPLINVKLVGKSECQQYSKVV
jgi:hypothetical protein